MTKEVKRCESFNNAKPGSFAPGAHSFVVFLWKNILDRHLSVTSVAEVSGIERANIYKWRNSIKGPYLMQVEAVLNALGYKIQIVKSDENQEKE